MTRWTGQAHRRAPSPAPGDDWQAAWAAALLDPGLACPPGLRVWDGSDPARRLAVHRNNVVAGLLQGLASAFPVLQRLVGEPFFQAMAAAFVRQAPPSTPVLADHGGGLAAFIDGFAPARGLPYLADMARLEWARLQALQAADALPLDATSGAAALTRLALAPDALASLRLVCHPSLQVLVAGRAVVSLWAAHQDVDGDGDGLPDEDRVAAVDLDQAECALVLRPRREVLVVPVSAGEARLAQALQGRAGLADAAAGAAAVDHGFDLAGALRKLLLQGALTDLQPH